MHTDLEFVACHAAMQAHDLLLSLGFTDWIVENTHDPVAEAECSQRRYRIREGDNSFVMVELYLQDDGGEPYPVGAIKHAPFATEFAYPTVEIFRIYPGQLPLLKEFLEYAAKVGEAMRAIPFPGVPPKAAAADCVVESGAATPQ